MTCRSAAGRLVRGRETALDNNAAALRFGGELMAQLSGLGSELLGRLVQRMPYVRRVLSCDNLPGASEFGRMLDKRQLGYAYGGVVTILVIPSLIPSQVLVYGPISQIIPMRRGEVLRHLGVAEEDYGSSVPIAIEIPLRELLDPSWKQDRRYSDCIPEILVQLPPDAAVIVLGGNDFMSCISTLRASQRERHEKLMDSGYTPG